MMNRKSSLINRILGFVLAVCMVTALCAGAPAQSTEAAGDAADSVTEESETVSGASAEASVLEEQEFDPLSIIRDTIDYSEYTAGHADAARPAAAVEIEGGSFMEADEGFERLENYDGLDGASVMTPEEGSVTWSFEVPESGFYNIELVYHTTPGKNNTIERELMINGEIPFEQALYLEFTRVWKDYAPIAQDSRDNDVRPRQTEEFCWCDSFLTDSDGFFNGALNFFFEKGINTLTLKSVKEPMVVGRIILTQEELPMSYSEYYAKYSAQGAQRVSLAENIKLQGEEAGFKSVSTLYPIADRTSPLTEPMSAAKLRLNTIGGTNWNLVGQWISWEFEVPETGFYELDIKFRQNIKTGVTVTRCLSIDGTVPFEEAAELTFPYKNEWCMCTPGDEEPYLFYLTAGKHELRLDITLGDELAEILRIADDSVTELNRAYRLLLMIIGSSPDTMRDYQLTKKTPEALSILRDQYEKLNLLSEYVIAYSAGSKGSESAAIDNLIVQLGHINEEPEMMAKYWSAFKDNIVALGSWTLSMKEQPLEIDYMLISEPGSSLPKVKAGFFAKLVHEIKKFFASFVEDYDSIGEVYGTEAVEVWVLADAGSVTSVSGSGRDQANTIKTLVDNYFIPETGIPVNVKLVNKDVLLSATLAGTGPDVALNVAGKEPVNYALRNAVCDLSQFDDFEEVTKWFHPEAMKQFEYAGGTYALPQTMSFHVMFYRADILKEIGAKVPQNWDEFYETLAIIQKNNMNVGIFPDYTTYAMFLYQHGGDFYTENGDASALDSEAAIAAFQMWSSNYADYRMPITFDFANRFRTGEMPLAIGDYTNYNYLSVFAPEIRGLWGFTIVPAYIDEDGEHRQVSAWESASIIMDTSDCKENAWEFLKWWMSAETQSEYGNDIENVLGVAGRVATANLEALSNLPWSSNDYKQLMAQMQYVEAIPEVAGGYFTEREIKFAFYSVYNSQEDARETLENYVKIINNEIENKRKEFNLD